MHCSVLYTIFINNLSCNKKLKKFVSKDAATMYGYRGGHPDVHYLSPYEFRRYWDIKLLSYPKTLKDVDNPKHHVHMTEAGLKKLSALQVPSLRRSLISKLALIMKCWTKATPKAAGFLS